MPTFTGRNIAIPFSTTKTPSRSLGFLVARLPTAVPGVVFTSLGTSSWARTVSTMIGMESDCFRVSVTIRAVDDRSGRIPAGGLSR